MEIEDVFKFMPKELAELILSELEPADLARASGVNVHWRKLASSNLLWRKFFNDTQNVQEPLKTVYGNRKVNWMNCKYKMSVMKHPHGTFYIAKTFPNSNVLYTGCLSDVMEEWDLEKAEKICEYEVPTGPASNYRMDETHCLIERENSLKRWKRHKESDSSGSNETFDWVYENPSDENTAWLKYFQAYQFVRERCVMATVSDNGTLIVQLYDMEKNLCVWRQEVKVVDVPAEDPANPDRGYLARLEWDSLSMSYDVAAVVYRYQVIVLDLNKHEVKFHLRDDMGEQTGRQQFFSVCAMHKDTLLASKADQVYFYNLKDGDLLFTVPLLVKDDGYHNANMGWARLDGEKAVVCSPARAFIIDIQKRCSTGTLEWSDYSRGWTQDVAMNDDFFAVLASNDVIVFDFRKRSKEQEQKDAEALKRLQEEHARFLEEERERQAKEAEENEKRWEQYRLDHPEEFPDLEGHDHHDHDRDHDNHDHDQDHHDYDNHDHDSSSSEEQPSIPPAP